MSELIRWFADLRMDDVPLVGGKNASLGEMVANLSSMGIKVPNGFATTAVAYRRFLKFEDLDQRINAMLNVLDVEDLSALAKTGSAIRRLVLSAPLPPDLEAQIKTAYAQLNPSETGTVAVRSSATAEDLPEASFAGQQETFLNVRGSDQVLAATKEVFASLFNDRAIAYRVHQGFDHADVALSVGVQQMVRADCGASGVIFTIDTESGFEDAVFITAAWGLGECVVQGAVNPDEFYVYKPALAAGKPAVLRRNRGSKLIKMVYSDHAATADNTTAAADNTTTTQAAHNNGVATIAVDVEQQLKFSISDAEVTQLAKMAVTIEQHYARPMDIEWGKDGITGELLILQARPETVASRSDKQVLERYQLNEAGKLLVTGRSIGQKIGSGVVRLVPNIADLAKVQPGDVLVTDMTDPDWEPVMQRAAAIVTNRGGRTCHAAIIARELGVPAVVGCGNATALLADGSEITVSCAEGDTGNIYAGLLDFSLQSVQLDSLPALPFKIMMNVGNPARAFAFSKLPNAGVGLARLEFIINGIGIHPKALLAYADMPPAIKHLIDTAMAGYASPIDFYVDKLSEGISVLGAAFAPAPVIVRLSDFKSNEYANMVGGELFEPDEENPMIGFRGAARYIDKSFRACFELECRAIKYVRDTMGMTHIQVMVPFVRTLEEAAQVTDLLAANGLRRGDNGLKVIMMCEVPSNAVLATQFLAYFDGMSIGSNDLTQLSLGLDRDSAVIAHLFNERDPAVKALISTAIEACKAQNKYIGICGQGPSDYPDFAQWLMQQGIDSVSLNPDTVVQTWLYLADDKP